MKSFIDDIFETTFYIAIILIIIVAMIGLLLFSLWSMYYGFTHSIWWLIIIGFICLCLLIAIIYTIFEM